MTLTKDTGTFKAITGGDKIMGERKHKDGFSFRAFCTMIFSYNKATKNRIDKTDAFYKRLIIIRFENVVPEDKIDRDLWDKLELEADGIFMWALAGLKRLMANNWTFSTTARTNSEVQQYKKENSNVLAFAEECCAFEPNAETLRDEIYRAYLEYCDSAGHKYRALRDEVNSELESHYGLTRSRDKITRRHTFAGIRLL